MAYAVTAAELAGLGLIGAGTYGANALASGGDERWDRTAVNTAGNLAGAGAGMMAGGYLGARMYRTPAPTALSGFMGGVGALAGALGGGYISDRVSDMVDPTQGRISPTELLNAHLENDPIAQQAMYQEKIRQARLMQREQQRQQMLQYQAQMAQQQGA